MSYLIVKPVRQLVGQLFGTSVAMVLKTVICFHDAIGMADVLSLSVKPCRFAGFAHILEFHAFLIVLKLF